MYLFISKGVYIQNCKRCICILQNNNSIQKQANQEYFLLILSQNGKLHFTILGRHNNKRDDYARVYITGITG